MKRTNIFLSCCWNDSNEADKIYNYFKSSQNIELHRDTIDIGRWENMKITNRDDFADYLVEKVSITQSIIDEYTKLISEIKEYLDIYILILKRRTMWKNTWFLKQNCPI